MARIPGILSKPKEIEALAAELSKHSIISFDTEFIRENTFFPVVELIQVATDTDSWLVDAQPFRIGRPGASAGEYGVEGIRPLLNIFQDKKILKIIHAAQGDQECLATAFNVVASPSMDTAIAASLCGYGDGIGLGNLLKTVLGVSIKKGHARTNWSVRPLPDQLHEYAHADVETLVAAGRKLIAELEKKGRKEWAMEQSAKYEEMSLYEPDPDGLTDRLAKGGKLDLKGYSALVELMRWRETRVRQLNLPRRWVADDQVLIDLANVRPKDMAHLSAFRGLNKGELKNSGEAILEALKRAQEAPKTDRPARGPRLEQPSAQEARVLDLLQAYVAILADRHAIAPKHLMTASQLLPLLRAKAQSPQDWVTQKILTEGAVRLAGDEIWAFLHGKRALSVDSTKSERCVKIVELE